MVEVDKLISAYKRKQQKEKERYERLKQNPDFVKKNRMRAKNHYEKNKEKKIEKYKSNIDYERAKSSFYYYKKRNNIETFKSRYPERYELMKDKLDTQ